MRCEAENEKCFKVCGRFYLYIYIIPGSLMSVLPQPSQKVKDILGRKLTRLAPGAGIPGTVEGRGEMLT